MNAKILPFANLIGKPVRTSVLCLISALMAAAVFGGSILVFSLGNGLHSLEERMGADVIVVPDDAAPKVENILLQGTPEYFYMDKGFFGRIEEVPGIEKISAQYFLVSAKAECCTAKVQIIGFDEKSDFTVKPWLGTAYSGSLGENELIAGSGINTHSDGELTLYGVTCKVVGKLEETGTGLDTAVYATNNTVKGLILGAQKQGISVLSRQSPDDVISSVYIKVSDKTDIGEVVSEINQHIDGVQAIRTKTMMTATADKLAVITKIITVMMIVVWVLAAVIMLAAFRVTANERKREFAVLRMIGYSRKRLGRVLLGESLVVCAAGGLVGVLLTAIAVLPFGRAIEYKTGLPMLLPDIPLILIFAGLSAAAVLVTGPLASAYSAYKLSRADTADLLREVN